jgi:hypothetical protein
MRAGALISQPQIPTSPVAGRPSINCLPKKLLERQSIEKITPARGKTKLQNGVWCVIRRKVREGGNICVQTIRWARVLRPTSWSFNMKLSF